MEVITAAHVLDSTMDRMEETGSILVPCRPHTVVAGGRIFGCAQKWRLGRPVGDPGDDRHPAWTPDATLCAGCIADTIAGMGASLAANLRQHRGARTRASGEHRTGGHRSARGRRRGRTNRRRSLSDRSRARRCADPGGALPARRRPSPGCRPGPPRRRSEWGARGVDRVPPGPGPGGLARRHRGVGPFRRGPRDRDRYGLREGSPLRDGHEPHPHRRVGRRPHPPRAGGRPIPGHRLQPRGLRSQRRAGRPRPRITSTAPSSSTHPPTTSAGSVSSAASASRNSHATRRRSRIFGSPSISKTPELAHHNSLGFCLFKLGRHAEAVASFEHAVAVDPTSAIDWANIGVNLERMGEASGPPRCTARPSGWMAPSGSRGRGWSGSNRVESQRARRSSIAKRRQDIAY